MQGNVIVDYEGISRWLGAFLRGAWERVASIEAFCHLWANEHMFLLLGVSVDPPYVQAIYDIAVEFMMKNRGLRTVCIYTLVVVNASTLVPVTLAVHEWQALEELAAGNRELCHALFILASQIVLVARGVETKGDT